MTRRRGALPRVTLSAEGYGWGRECCVLCAECGEMALPPCREPFEVVEGGGGAEVSFVGFGRLPKVKTSMDEPTEARSDWTWTRLALSMGTRKMTGWDSPNG